MKTFASDNYSGVCDEVMQAIQAANQGHAAAYGHDIYTEEAIALIKQHFGENVVPYFVFNGTGANTLGLKAILKSHEAILCTDCSHIHFHEVGAPTQAIGCALITIPNEQGKMTAERLEESFQQSQFWGRHNNKPAVVSISQPTEYGTVYTADEIKAIAAICKKYQLLLHMDGCRLVNAAAYLQTSLSALTTDVGVDVVSFGGTKNGLMFGEVIIFIQKPLAKDFDYIQKQGLQLASKMRYLSAQFIPYLKDGICFRNAKHANDMCLQLANHLQNKKITFAYPVQTNQLFVYLSTELIAKTKTHCPYYTWDENTHLVRLVTSFDTTQDDIENFMRLGWGNDWRKSA